MINVDLTDLKLKHLITHHVGNKLRDENVKLSSDLSSLEEQTRQILLKYFLLPVKTEEFFSFSHPVELSRNDLFTISEGIFSNPDSFIQNSQSIAKLLYEYSMHPKIKEGELNISYFTGIRLDDELVDAVGIFKSETNVPFIKMENENLKFKIHHDYGYEIKGIDKGCIVLNSDKENGYKILLIDNAAKGIEAQYWKDDFLKVRPNSDEYHQTNELLAITKNFIKNQLSEDVEITKTDQIDILNRSVEYFKTHNTFEKKTFESEVFQEDNIIKSFRNFDETYRSDNASIGLSDGFEISQAAVKKQSRSLKNVLKLDKNFHIYIHNNNGLIEQGVDENGRKYYKIYYQNEQ